MSVCVDFTEGSCIISQNSLLYHNSNTTNRKVTCASSPAGLHATLH